MAPAALEAAAHQSPGEPVKVVYPMRPGTDSFERVEGVLMQNSSGGQGVDGEVLRLCGLLLADLPELTRLFPKQGGQEEALSNLALLLDMRGKSPLPTHEGSDLACSKNVLEQAATDVDEETCPVMAVLSTGATSPAALRRTPDMPC